MRVLLFISLLVAFGSRADHFGRGRTDPDGVEGHSSTNGTTLYQAAPRSVPSGEGDGTAAFGAKPGAIPPRKIQGDREWFLFIVTGPRSVAGEPDPTRVIAGIVKESAADVLLVHQQPFEPAKLLESVNIQKKKLLQSWDRLGGAAFIHASDIVASARDRDGVTANELEDVASRMRDILFPEAQRSAFPTRDLSTILVGGKAGRVRCPFRGGELFRLSAPGEAQPISTLLHWLHPYADKRTAPPLFPRSAAEWYDAWEPQRPRWLLPALCGLGGEVPKGPPRIPVRENTADSP